MTRDKATDGGWQMGMYDDSAGEQLFLFFYVAIRMDQYNPHMTLSVCFCQ